MCERIYGFCHVCKKHRRDVGRKLVPKCEKCLFYSAQRKTDEECESLLGGMKRIRLDEKNEVKEIKERRSEERQREFKRVRINERIVREQIVKADEDFLQLFAQISLSSKSL